MITMWEMEKAIREHLEMAQEFQQQQINAPVDTPAKEINKLLDMRKHHQLMAGGLLRDAMSRGMDFQLVEIKPQQIWGDK